MTIIEVVTLRKGSRGKIPHSLVKALGKRDAHRQQKQYSGKVAVKGSEIHANAPSL